VESSVMLEKLPKSVIEIYIMVLQSDGGELGAAITCASLALADSGIELFGLVSGCCVGSKGETLLADCPLQ
jgi:exosome complex component MTR3